MSIGGRDKGSENVAKNVESVAKGSENVAKVSENKAKGSENMAENVESMAEGVENIAVEREKRKSMFSQKGIARTAARNRRTAKVLRFLVRFGAGATAASLLLIVTYILVMGIPNISLDLFALPYNSTNVSLMPALINTLLMTGFSLIIAIPLGLGAAIYLVEYTARGNRFVGVIRITAETLTGIPSIVYGLFGMLFFVTALKWRISLIAGAFTLAIMILPIIMRTAEEALKAVPDSYREGSFSLGAGRLRTVFKVLLPAAIPGILAGVILGIGRIFGESAALIYTAGTVAALPSSVFSSTRTLSVHMYVLASEGLHVGKTYATAVVLLVFVVIINTLSAVLARRITKGSANA